MRLWFIEDAGKSLQRNLRFLRKGLALGSSCRSLEAKHCARCPRRSSEPYPASTMSQRKKIGIDVILKMQSPEYGFAFEWHPEARAVYCLNFNNGNKHEQIAANIITPEAAQLAALMWCRGYQSRAREITRRPGVKHYQMLAEGGAVGASMGSKTIPLPPVIERASAEVDGVSAAGSSRQGS